MTTEVREQMMTLDTQEFFLPTLWVENWRFGVKGEVDEWEPPRLVSPCSYVGRFDFMKAVGENGGQFMSIEHNGNLTHVVLDRSGKLWMIMSLGREPK